MAERNPGADARDPNPDDRTPIELIRIYGTLKESARPLADLVRVNPGLAEEIIALAMVMGIHAGEKEAERQRVFSLVENDLRRGIRTMFGGSD
jgi:hypothetical protein